MFTQRNHVPLTLMACWRTMLRRESKLGYALRLSDKFHSLHHVKRGIDLWLTVACVAILSNGQRGVNDFSLINSASLQNGVG